MSKWCGWRLGATHYSGTLCPCHCEGVRSTLKTLAYGCDNPVQYVCEHSPAVLFIYWIATLCSR